MAKDEKTETVSENADDRFDRLIQALMASRSEGITKDDLAAILDANARGIQRALKPDNPEHPGKSAFSYPEGDRARPRPALPCEFYYNAYPVHMFPETEHWRELELMAQVKPGDYTVIRKDGSKTAVTVKGERNADGKLTKLEVIFPVSREDKHLIPPKHVVLYQLVYSDNPRKRFVEAMNEHLSLVFGETVAV